MPKLSASSGRSRERYSGVQPSVIGRHKGRPKLTDPMIYESLAAAIFEQRLAPGTKLREDKLAGNFGVGLTLIRNALVRLGNNGIVDLRPNRGAVVASPTAEEAVQVFEAPRRGAGDRRECYRAVSPSRILPE